MKLVFVSNYINHHQIPVSDSLYELTEGDYAFIQCEPMEAERINMGWDKNAINRPYVKLYYQDKENCDRLILESDCVIFGGCEDETIIRPRLEANKFTIRYSERLYKEGRWKFVSPRGLKKKYHDHTMFRNNDIFLLCAGAFVKGDYSLFGAYPGKKMKYGYFPKLETYENVHFKRLGNFRTEILWAARFIDWKHPEMMLALAKKLKENGVLAHITMIGIGELLDEMKHYSCENNLDEYITFAGKKTPDEVRDMMLSSDVFVSTSDMKEGWGAVINEAMNSGCLTIAGDKIGAVPYLIKYGENGFSFKNKSVSDLYEKVLYALNNRTKSLEMGTQAYKTVQSLWNAQVAAKRLYDFINNPEHIIPDYKDGPLSKA